MCQGMVVHSRPVKNLPRYLWQTLAPVRRSPGLLGWAQQGVAVFVVLAAAVGWKVSGNSPVLWVSLVGVGLVLLFAISGFQAYRELNSPFPRMAVSAQTVTYDSATMQVLVDNVHVTNRERNRRVSLSFCLTAWNEGSSPTDPLVEIQLWNNSTNPDPLNLPEEQTTVANLRYEVLQGGVGDEGPKAFLLTILDRVSGKTLAMPIPGTHPREEDTLYPQ